MIERVTGARPPTCPWRAMYHPLVMEVLAVIDFDETGNLATAIGTDPPALLVESIATYTRALKATRAEEYKLRAEKWRRDREAAQ